MAFVVDAVGVNAYNTAIVWNMWQFFCDRSKQKTLGRRREVRFGVQFFLQKIRVFISRYFLSTAVRYYVATPFSECIIPLEFRNYKFHLLTFFKSDFGLPRMFVLVELRIAHCARTRCIIIIFSRVHSLSIFRFVLKHQLQVHLRNCDFLVCWRIRKH